MGMTLKNISFESGFPIEKGNNIKFYINGVECGTIEMTGRDNHIYYGVIGSEYGVIGDEWRDSWFAS